MATEPNTIKDACELAGISYQQAWRYMRDGRLPRYVQGETPFAQWAAQLRTLRDSAPNKPTAGEGELGARQRWELARAEKLEIANAEKRGRLLDRDAVLLAASRVAGVIRDALEALPVRVAPDDFELRSRLEREVHDVLTHLSSLDPEEVTR